MTVLIRLNDDTELWLTFLGHPIYRMKKRRVVEQTEVYSVLNVGRDSEAITAGKLYNNPQTRSE